LSQVNTFYTNKYLPLTHQITDNETGFQAKIKSSKQAENEISKLKKLSAEQYAEVRNYANELRKKNREFIEVDHSIKRLLEDVTSKHKSVIDLHKSVDSLESKITIIQENLEKLYISSEEKEKTISSLLLESDNGYKVIQHIKEDSASLLEEIQSIYEIAAETGLSGEFDKRGMDLKKLLRKWEGRILITSIILLAIIVLMFVCQLALYKWDLTNHTFDINFYIRFLIASPIVYYLYFCSSEYSQTKMLYDKYNFKTTLAMSIKHHLMLLTQHEKFGTDDRINKILEFILDGFRKIYSEPHTNEDYKLKLKLANLELDFEKKIIETITKALKKTGMKIHEPKT
jgi:hypothetical protein